MQTVDFRRFPLRDHHRVLDLGCGEGRHSIAAWLQRAGVCGVDLDLESLKRTRAKQKDFLPPASNAPAATALGLCCADSLQLPFRDNFFDRIICSEMLEHIDDYAAALREIRRVLKPDGLLCISVPSYWPERVCWALSSEYAREPGGHVRIFRSGALRRCVQELGFHCYARRRAHALHSPYWWLRCLFWPRKEEFLPLRLFHRLLVWDMMRRPRLTRWLEALLNPLLGKSVVLYFRLAEQT